MQQSDQAHVRCEQILAWQLMRRDGAREPALGGPLFALQRQRRLQPVCGHVARTRMNKPSGTQETALIAADSGRTTQLHRAGRHQSKPIATRDERTQAGLFPYGKCASRWVHECMLTYDRCRCWSGVGMLRQQKQPGNSQEYAQKCERAHPQHMD